MIGPFRRPPVQSMEIANGLPRGWPFHLARTMNERFLPWPGNEGGGNLVSSHSKRRVYYDSGWSSGEGRQVPSRAVLLFNWIAMVALVFLSRLSSLSAQQPLTFSSISLRSTGRWAFCISLESSWVSDSPELPRRSTARITLKHEASTARSTIVKVRLIQKVLSTFIRLPMWRSQF